MVFCLLDGGRDLDAVELAEADWDRVWRRSREDTARATAGWVLTEAQWLAGNPQRALEVADQVSTLDVPGYVGVVGSATMAAWAARALDQAPPASTLERATSHFPNFRGGTLEAEALLAASPADASVIFERAATAFAGVSARSCLRVRWAAADAAADAGDRGRAVRLLRELEPDAARYRLAWLDRRLDATRRRLGVRRSSKLSAVAPPAPPTW